MRKTIFALATSALLAGVAFVGCGGDDAPANDGGVINDLATNADLTPPVKIGCKGYSACMIDCLTPSSATLQGCITTCNKNAKSSTVSTKWLDMLDCGQSYCLGNADAGGYKCTLDASGSTLTDRPGDPMDTCGNCLNDSLAAAFGASCANMSSPDCNPAACKPKNDACLTDLP